jgi:predicted nucleotidyltransferase
MNHGLNDRDLNTIRAILNKHRAIQKVYIFGSRAMGNWHKGSDIDLAIMDDKVSEEVIREISADFEESSLPYFVDVVHFNSTRELALKDHISRFGKLFYEREKANAVHEPGSEYSKE